jgi:hypothetical protein
VITTPLPKAHYRKVPLAELTEPPHGRTVQVIRDYWWRVTDDDCVLFYTRGMRRYYGSPQCNQNRAIAAKVGEGLYPWPTTVRQIPIVFVPHVEES